MNREASWIKSKAALSLSPTQVEHTLEQLRERWPADARPIREVVEHFPLGEAALLHLLAVSAISSRRILRDPDLLLWLANPEICADVRGYSRMLGDLRNSAGDDLSVNNFSALRTWKGWQMTRVALRELANAASLEETTADLSRIAEIALSQVYEHWNRVLRERHGSPESDFIILALGKLGGYELNHSSDIDLMFVYSAEGQLAARSSYHEWFNRLGKKILDTFSASDPAGALHRVDLRLRPEGSAGPLARSLQSTEYYYSGFGETWERLALIKARTVSGSRELAYDFLRQLQPFVYPKSRSPDLLEEIAAIKARIERDIVGLENLTRDVKLGSGGIREIEFIVQALQLIHGARHTFLQETSTIRALQALAQLDLLPRAEVLALDNAYRFLRKTEHRLQIEEEQQTHTVPEDGQSLEQLARSLGYNSADEFSAALRAITQRVRNIFERVMSTQTGRADPKNVDLGMFRDEKRAIKALGDLANVSGSFHVAPRTRQVFRKLRPLLLAQLSKVADADATMTQFVRFVESYGMRSMLFELLVTHPRLLELLVKTFDASRVTGGLLVRKPQLLEEITRGGLLDRSIDVATHLRRLEKLGATEFSLDSLRAYRQAELLRILLRDILDIVDLPTLLAEHSELAEACLIFLAGIVGADNLTIIALGKFGGAEISYGADLDILFVGDEARAAQNLIVATTQPSAEGGFFALDARLRPEGDKGPLVAPLEAYTTYYSNRAQFWELHALTRARPICGPMQQEFLELAQAVWRNASKDADLLPKIDSMLQRIRQERSSGAEFLNFKTGAGGIVEAEFLVQALQMRADIWAPNWSEALNGLIKTAAFSGSEASGLKAGYQFLRRLESALRRWEHKSVSTLPDDQHEQRKIARWLGFTDLTQFVKEYHDARTTIHDIYRIRVSG